MAEAELKDLQIQNEKNEKIKIIFVKKMKLIKMQL